MNKKKIAVLLVAGVMTVGVVGGTLAWFTSWDSVTNVFETGKDMSDSNTENGNGVEIYEQFNSPDNVVPGDTTIKLVQTKNTTSYDSFIRVSFEKLWKDLEDKKVEGLDEDYINLNFTNNVVRYDVGKYVYVNVNTNEEVTDPHGKWIEHTDGYYYYVGRVPGGKYTNTLLESVTLSTDADNDYRDKRFDVIVNAESIQADNDAYRELGLREEEDKLILDLLKKYSKDEENLHSGNENADDNVTVTDTNESDEK